MPDYGDLKLQFYYDNKWNDAPLADPKRGPVQIVRGRGPEQESASPSTLSATVDNFSGDYNPHNPASDLYRKIGRNTPARVYLGDPNMVGAVDSDLDDATSQDAPSVDAPDAGLLICVWATPGTGATYTMPSEMTAGAFDVGDALLMAGAREIVSSGGDTGTRTATLSAADQFMAASVFVVGPSSASTGTVTKKGTSFTIDSKAAGDVWVMVSAFASEADSAASPPVSPASPSDTDGGGWLLLADTGDLHLQNGGAEWARMKVWAKVCRTVNDAHTIQLPGADDDRTISWLTRVPAADVDGDWDIRFAGEVAAWRPDRTGNFVPGSKGDAWTGVEAAGVLRRIGQGSEPLQSTIRSTVLNGATLPVAYWPMEDGQDATQFASGLVAGTPMPIRQFGQIDLATDDSLPGSLPLPQATRDGDPWHLPLLAEAPLSGLDGSRWTVGFWSHIPFHGSVDPDNNQIIVTIFVDDSDDVVLWLVETYYDQNIDKDFFGVAGKDKDGNLFAVAEANLDHSDGWRDVRAVITSSGGSSTTELYVDGTLVDAGSDSVTGGRPVRAHVNIFGPEPNVRPVSMGHLAVWSGAVDPGWSDAGSGYAGETAGARFLRVCRERGIPASVRGAPDESTPMGPQRPDTLINLLAEIERTDAGILYEPRDQLGLVYRTRRSLYNQTAALTLDWDDGRMSPLAPVLDDRYTRNDVTARRRDGSFARAVQETGPLNVQDPADDPDGAGRYESEMEVNPETDAALEDLASWYLHLGTIDGPRFPQLTVDLDLYSAVAGDAAAVDIGDRILITNVPTDVAPDDINLIVVGGTEQITPTRRTITFNCVPASAYDVAVYDQSRYASKRTYRHSSSGPITETAAGITFRSDVPWVTDPDQFPFDIMVGGERMTVTAIGTAVQESNGEFRQLWMVIRSVNGVVKSHPVGVTVQLAEPPRYAL